jgi:hypothetical protein
MENCTHIITSGKILDKKKNKLSKLL